MTSETDIDETETFEALQRLRALPEPISHKRLRKEQLGSLPQRRLHGWGRITWEMKKGLKHARVAWTHDLANFGLFKGSIQAIEVQCGTAIVNVFLFIRWTLLLNLVTAVIFLFAVILPFFVSNHDAQLPWDQCTKKFNVTDMRGLYDKYIENNTDTVSKVVRMRNRTIGKDHYLEFTGANHTQTRLDCCTKQYHQNLKVEEEVIVRGTLAIIFHKMKITLEDSPMFYGYYIHRRAPGVTYDVFAISYVITVVGALLLSLILMVRGVGVGIEEIIYTSEGEHHEYTNLIFAGWDHCTDNAKSAKFKHKILRNEMKIALSTEKNTLEQMLRSRRDRIKTAVVRLLINFIVAALLVGSTYCIYLASVESIDKKTKFLAEKQSRTRQLKIILVGFVSSITLSVFNLIFPVILTRLGKYERYSLHTATALVLFRALLIRIMSVGVSAWQFYKLGIKCQKLKDDAVCTECPPRNVTEKGKPDKVVIDYRQPCWESIFADQIYKLMFVDLILKLVITFIIEPVRTSFKKCCPMTNKVCRVVATIKFSIVRHSLDIIYLQVLSWIGMYFSPFIPIMTCLYCVLVFFIKQYSVLHNCNDVPNTYKTTKTTMMFILAKLMAFVTVAFFNVFVINKLEPSRDCGPFRENLFAWESVQKIVSQNPTLLKVYSNMASPGVSAPITMLLILAGYYYYSVAQANRGMVETLRHLLILEGHDKQYLFARLNSLRQAAQDSNTRAIQSRQSQAYQNE